MEFDVIEHYFKPLSLSTQPGDLAIGDDGALITPPAHSQLVVVTDTLVSGVHFLPDADPYYIGWKALAVNLSDLAAMGAKPAFYSLALTLPQVDQVWLSEFVAGLADCAKAYAIPLIGGDTTRGPLCITVTAQGWLPQGQALLRSGAKAGDDIYVSGWIGEAGYGLSLAMSGKKISLNSAEQTALECLNRPIARVELGLALRGMASSAIDVSDGLLADLSHILRASKVGAVLHEFPLSAAVQHWAQGDTLKALKAGDDYELCFTAPVSLRDEIDKMAEQCQLKITRIGRISEQPGLVIEGLETLPQHLGYEHF